MTIERRDYRAKIITLKKQLLILINEEIPAQTGSDQLQIWQIATIRLPANEILSAKEAQTHERSSTLYIKK